MQDFIPSDILVTHCNMKVYPYFFLDNYMDAEQIGKWTYQEFSNQIIGGLFGRMFRYEEVGIKLKKPGHQQFI